MQSERFVVCLEGRHDLGGKSYPFYLVLASLIICLGVVSGRFNSVLGQSRTSGGKVDHREYVFFDKAQAVPIAVVTYRHKPSCMCSRCSD